MNEPRSVSRPVSPRVALFATCLVDAMRPSVGFAALKLLRDAGCRVEVPQAQTCCGQPAFTSGFPDEARQVVESQLGLFPGDYPIVVPSGS